MSEKVLVTGCGGYIGSTLVGYLLNAGYEVIGCDTLFYNTFEGITPYIRHPKFYYHNTDVRSMMTMETLIKKSDIIIPLAALVGAPICDKYPEIAQDVNATAIRHMTYEISKNQKIIFPNTNSGYGIKDNNIECTEEESLNPISLYGQSKCEAEKYVLDKNNSCVFRLATVFGASPRQRMDLMVNDFTEKLTRIKQKPITKFTLFEPNFKRNFIHVADVCRAMIFALDRDLTGVYNLGLPIENLTKLQLSHKICDVLKLNKNIINIGDGQDADKRDYIVSNKKILNTGFKFQYDLEYGIKQINQLCETFPEEITKKMRNV